MGTNLGGSFFLKPKNPRTLVRTLCRHRFYLKIAFCLFKTIQSSFQLLILTLKICGSTIQKKLVEYFTQFPFYCYYSSTQILFPL